MDHVGLEPAEYFNILNEEEKRDRRRHEYIAVADPVELWGRFLAYCESDGNYVVTGVKDARASAKVWMQGDASRDGFVAKIKLYSVHRTLSVYAVEWQRRSGCSLSSHEAFDRFKARFAMPVM